MKTHLKTLFAALIMIAIFAFANVEIASASETKPMNENIQLIIMGGDVAVGTAIAREIAARDISVQVLLINEVDQTPIEVKPLDISEMTVLIERAAIPETIVVMKEPNLFNYKSSPPFKSDRSKAHSIDFRRYPQRKGVLPRVYYPPER